MEGDLDIFDDEDDDLLRTLPLEFLDEDNQQVVPTAPPIANPKQETEKEVIHHTRDTFPFPFTPYEIQVGFMQQLYNVLERSKIGIFESPTGTGKSLSLICGAISWLKDQEARKQEELEKLIEEENSKEESTKDDGLDWIKEFAKKREVDEQKNRLKEEHEMRLKREERLKAMKKGKVHKFKRKREALEEQFDELFKNASSDLQRKLSAELSSTENVDSDSSHTDDMNLMLDDYISDDDSKEESKDDEQEEYREEHVTKIYYCSRTHSQLAQFVSEVQKSPFADDVRVVTLGSRQNLCINETVKRLKSVTQINDRCRDLKKKKSGIATSKKNNNENTKKKRKTTDGCPFYKSENITDYTDKVLVDVQDIEQLVTLGRTLKACPYYGTRYAIPAAEVVALPYNSLLHRATRESSGIKLQGNIVIIDEAHNLVETISNIHSIEITGSQVSCAYSQLSQYMDRYCTRLTPKNLMYIKQILFILSNFVKALGGKTGIAADQQKNANTATHLLTLNDFLFDTKMDNMNLFKIIKYCERSLISRKLNGFVEKYQPPEVPIVEEKKTKATPTWALSNFLQEISQTKDNARVEIPKGDAKNSVQDSSPSSAVFSSPLMHIEGFLLALTTMNKDGRIVINKQDLLSRSSLKFLLLNPAVHFSEVVSQARAVIVAGGTMQPLSEFKEQLFYAAGADPSRIMEYSCGHVIAKENLLPIALGRGSSGKGLDFTYSQRDQIDMMDELGRVVYNVCNVVPGGVVCFFPSYEYERRVYDHWESAGFLNKILAKKKIFREPKKAQEVDRILNEYSTYIKKSMQNKNCIATGSLMLCVVGGKMSEGINFADDMGRCVIMVGLPYPNMRSPELKEKMDYLNATMPRGVDGKLPGQIHYENLCFKAVNQSIGRAIRHKNDYACILMLDQRYLRPSVKSKLPSWIGSHLQPYDRFGPAFAVIRQFFTEKKDCDS